MKKFKTIYILVDCDSDVSCAFDDKEVAVKEGNECGCDVEEIRLYEKSN